MDKDLNMDLSFQRNNVLFGHDLTPGLVSFEVEGQDRITVFRRQESVTHSEALAFRPFLLLGGEGWIKGWKGEYSVELLRGDAPFSHLITFPDLDWKRPGPIFRKKVERVPEETGSGQVLSSEKKWKGFLCP